MQVDVTAEAARAEAIARGWSGRVEQVDELVEPARAEVARAYSQEFDDHNVVGAPPVGAPQ